jgi:hypothetical protein
MKFVGHVATRILNAVKDVNRVMHDIIGIVFMVIGTYLALRIA